MKQNKTFRILYLYKKLLRGTGIVKKEASEFFQVDDKTIQRDIEEIRNYIHQQNMEEGQANSLIYDQHTRSYQLLKQDDYVFNEKEILALAKILLDSRAFNKQEMTDFINKLLKHIDRSQRKCLENAISNEKYYYIEPQHGKELLNILWDLNQCIQNQNIIKITYCRMDGAKNNWELEPQGLIFSEFYFYLIARVHNTNHENLAIFRIDRILSLTQTTEKFPVPYSERFEESKFRKRIQFMYGGVLLKVKFAFWGDSLEAVLDRLPTARIIGEDGNKTILKAEVYGKGIKMWFLSQGQYLELLEPESLRREIQKTIQDMGNIYR